MTETLNNLLSKGANGIADMDPLSVLLMAIVSLLFGLALKMLYFSYFKSNEPLDTSIPRSFPLIAPAVTSIFWLIQYSLPLSLGLLGALSFVRFRTPVKRAEDIAFILLVIACSLSVAVEKYMVALVLVLAVFVYGVVRHRLPVLEGQSGQHALITINTSSPVSSDAMLEALGREFPGVSVISSSVHDAITSIVFNVPSKSDNVVDRVRSAIGDDVENPRIDVFYPGQHLGGY